MKRMALITAIALTVGSCAQHDPNSPSTAGNDPQNPNKQSPAADSSDAANGMNNRRTQGATGESDNTRQYDSLPSSNNTGQQRNQ